MRFVVLPVLRVAREVRKSLAHIVRDEKICELRAQGMGNPKIAERTGIAVGTAWNAINKNG